eukprot:8064909-Ditylum_brightwellii.AAC.1
MLSTEGVQYMSVSMSEAEKSCNGIEYEMIHHIAILLFQPIPSLDRTFSNGTEIAFIAVED